MGYRIFSRYASLVFVTKGNKILTYPILFGLKFIINTQIIVTLNLIFSERTAK